MQREFAVSPYRPALQLNGIATAGVGVAFGGPFWNGRGGRCGVQFGDELEDHMIAATIQASGQIQDIGGQAVYIDQ